MPEDQPGGQPPFGVEKVGDEKRAASIRSALHELHNADKPTSPDNSFASTERAVHRLTKAVWAVAKQSPSDEIQVKYILPAAMK